MKVYAKRQLKADIAFLSDRASRTGSCSFSQDRDTGISSNSIVAIAYGHTRLSDQRFPSDLSDMRSCENMWAKMPEHRKEGDALAAMEAARNCNYHGKPLTTPHQ